MKITWILTLLIGVLSITTPLSAQEKSKIFSFSVGISGTEGQSKIDRTSPFYSAPVFTAEANATTDNVRIRNRFNIGRHQFGGSAFDLSIENAHYLGPARLGLVGRYFSAKDEDVIWDYDNLLVTGLTQKRYLLVGLSGGMGNYRDKNFRLYAMAGMADAHKFIRTFANGVELEDAPAIVNQDLLPVTMTGGTLAWPNIWQQVNIGLSVRNIRTVNIKKLEMQNTREIIPKNQVVIDLEVKRPINSWLDVGVNTTWSNTDMGMVFLGNSAGTKIVFKF